MPFWSRSEIKVIRHEGPGTFAFDVVGEASYQAELAQIVGGKAWESASFECEASLVFEDDNPYDKNAIMVLIADHQVGYLPRAAAASLRASFRRAGYDQGVIVVAALIVGGWKRDQDEGHFGVKLDLQ